MSITLKAARVNMGLTQVEAAKKLDVTELTLRNWEKNKTYPDAQQLKRIEELYNISFNDLIFLPNTSV